METHETGTIRPTEEETAQVRAYARSYYPDDSFIKDLQRVARYVPGIEVGYLKLRQSAYFEGPDAVLPPKMKELLLIAMAIGARKGSPPPQGHVRLAIDAGATLQEIAELVALSLMYCGGLTFHETGRHVLRYAEEYVASGERAGHESRVRPG